MGLFNGMQTSGPGIPKSEREKTPFFKFWEVYFRRFWKLILLNIIYFIACIPIVTIGPATAGMTKVVRNYSQERNAFVFHDFKEAFKKNFKQSFVMGIIDVIFALGFVTSIVFYYQMSKTNNVYLFLLAIVLSLSIIFIMMHFYIYLLIVSTTLNLRQILKNSFFLVAIAIKKNAITLLSIIVVVLSLVFLLNFYAIFIIPVWPLTFIGFLNAFNSFPVIRKYVIEPFYKAKGMESPEFDYLKKRDDDENVFTDMGGKEEPTDLRKNTKNRNKTTKIK